MTRLQQAVTVCANYQQGGLCLGIDYGPTGRPIKMATGGQRCVIHNDGICPYLDEICPPVEDDDKTDSKGSGMPCSAPEDGGRRKGYSETPQESVIHHDNI